MVSSLALCPDYTKEDSVAYGAEFGVVFLAKGPRTASIQRASIVSALTIRILRESATFGWSQECSNDWGGGGGYNDSVPGEVTKTTPSGDRIT